MTKPVMPESHEAFLKTLLQVEEDGFIPKNAEKAYWDMERTFRKAGERIGVKDICYLVLLLERPIPAAPKSFFDSNAQRDDQVLAKMRDEWVWGRYICVKSKKVRVVLSNGEEHDFSPLDVRLPTSEELSLVE